MAGYEELIAALGGLNQSLNNASNIVQANYTNKTDKKFTREMFEKQREWALESWMLQNRYSLPSAVRQRIEDAGLNPLLLYGNGGSVTSAAGSIGQPTPVSRVSHLPQTEAVGTQMGMMLAQIEQLRSQSRLQDAEALKAVQDSKKSEAETEGININNAWSRDTYQLRQDALEAEIKLKEEFQLTEQSKREQLSSQNQLNLKNIDFLENEIANKNKLTEQEIKESNQRITNSIKITAQQVSTLKAEERKALADAYLAQVTAKIKEETEGSPEWQKMQYSKLVGDAYNALVSGEAKDIENSFKRFELEMLPDPDASFVQRGAYVYRKFINYTVGPIGNLLSSALGGSIGAASK